MNSDEIKNKLIDMIQTLFPDSGVDKDILPYVDLIDDLGMDSITFISIVVEVEGIFNIIVPDDLLEMDNFHHLDDIVKIVESQMNTSEIEMENV